MTDDQFFGWLARLDKPASKALPRHMYGDPSRSAKFTNERNAVQRDIDEVEILLDIWADDMRRPPSDVQGYPSQASGGFIPSWCKDTEEAAEQADAETLVKINAAYDSLPRICQNAINRHYGLGHQVWRFAKDTSFEDAKIVMRVKLVTKGLL